MIPANNEIRFEVTTKCNYNCMICPREKLTRKLETMEFDNFKFLLDRIIKEVDQYTVCTFSGFGEPFLDPTLMEKIKYARQRKMEVLLLTNASLLTVEKFKLLDGLGVSSIRVSFYGDSPGIYNKMHNIKHKGQFEMIKERLVEICRIKTTTKVLFTYNVQEGINRSDTEHWIKFWSDKADLLEVWKPHNWVDGKTYRVVQRQKQKTCGRPWKTPLQVQVDGTVNMCCFDFNGQLTLGDLKTQTLQEIFSSPLYKKIVQYHLSGDFNGSELICDNCDQRNIDKSDVMVYNSKFPINERVGMVSTTYSTLT